MSVAGKPNLRKEILGTEQMQDFSVRPRSNRTPTCKPVPEERRRFSEQAVMQSHSWEKMRDLSISALKRFLRDNPGGLIQRLIGPRLGVLNQYSPRPLKVPAHYESTEPPESPPTISIVTPSFNHAHFLERTIRSVLDQNYPALEYIVRDGGSRDGSVEMLERYGSQLSHWESVPDAGQADALNRGFRQSTGEIMGYLNSDDLLLPGALNYVGRFFARNPGVDVVYGHRILIDQHDQEVGRWVMPRHVDWVLTWVDYLPQETMFWRRELWEKAGGALDVRLQFALDWDLILRFIKAHGRFVRLPRFLGAFRVHPQQKTLIAANTLGKNEVSAIRRTLHGRDVTSEEAGWRVKGYLLKHLLCHFCYSAGLFRY